MIDFDNIESLVSQLKDFISGKPAAKSDVKTEAKPPMTEATKPSAKVVGNVRYQAPIKGTFYNSGNFSLSQSDKSHPHGHKGVDLRAAGGTALYPIAPGIVTSVGTDPMGGNVVNIDHENGVRSYYAHCASVSVHKGDRVGYDDEIGKIGVSGNASNKDGSARTAPHCHVQVWKDNALQNPASYFPVPAYTSMAKEEKLWTSDKAKQEALNFDMKKHLSNKKYAKTNNQFVINACNEYYKLCNLD